MDPSLFRFPGEDTIQIDVGDLMAKLYRVDRRQIAEQGD